MQRRVAAGIDGENTGSVIAAGFILARVTITLLSPTLQPLRTIPMYAKSETADAYKRMNETGGCENNGQHPEYVPSSAHPGASSDRSAAESSVLAAMRHLT